MFIDASALVALIAREDGHEAIERRIEAADTCLTSGIAIFEAALAVRRIDGGSLGDAESFVRRLMLSYDMTVVAIANVESREALAAFARFGKGQGHPARLNLGDCFAYACAKTRGVPLLFVGDDFSHTDIPSATA